MTTCLLASLQLATTTAKIAMLAVLGLAVGLVLAPTVLEELSPPASASLSWTSSLDAALADSGAAPTLQRWTDPAYVRAQWTAFSTVLDG
jgi:hypothetical protein